MVAMFGAAGAIAEGAAAIQRLSGEQSQAAQRGSTRSAALASCHALEVVVSNHASVVSRLSDGLPYIAMFGSGARRRLGPVAPAEASGGDDVDMIVWGRGGRDHAHGGGGGVPAPLSPSMNDRGRPRRPRPGSLRRQREKRL